MRPLLFLTILLALSLPAFAQTTKPVTIGWDQFSNADLLIVHSIRIYDIVVPASPVQVAEAPCTINTPPTLNVCPITVNFSATVGVKHVWIARAWDGFQETGDSNTVTTPPGLPKNLRMP